MLRSYNLYLLTAILLCIALFANCSGFNAIPRHDAQFDLSVNDDQQIDSINQDDIKSDRITNDILLVDTIATCENDKLFCNGKEIRQCSSDGKSSEFVYSCVSYKIGTVDFTCQPCPNGYQSVMCVAKSPVFSGSLVGEDLPAYTYEYKPYCENYPNAGATFTSKEFAHNIVNDKTDGVTSLFLRVTDLTKLIPNQWNDFPETFSASHINVRINYTKNKISYSCGVPDFNPPPSTGRYKISYAKIQKGEAIQINVEADFSCDSTQTSEEFWKTFTYSATGFITAVQ